MVNDNFAQTVDWYSKNAQKYAGWVDDFYSSEQVTSFISMIPQGARVLDAGCGTGRDTSFMVASGLDVVGLDIAPGMIEVARSKHPNTNFVVGDFRKLEFPDASFDGVWCHAALINLETVDEVKQALVEFHRILKPQGVLHALVKKQLGEEKVIMSRDQESGGGRLVQYFTEEEFKNLLQQARLNPIIFEVYTENERNPQGRANVSWIHTLSQKAI